MLEEIISKACLNLTMAGDYFPLSGSRSFQTKPNGMDEEKQTELRGKGNLYEHFLFRVLLFTNNSVSISIKKSNSMLFYFDVNVCPNSFQEPDSTLLLSSGMARHWPDARGTYHNDAKNVFVWVYDYIFFRQSMRTPIFFCF